MGDSQSLESRVASVVHAHFDALPRRSKPAIHPNGKREWIPLSGIVLVTGENTPRASLTCVALATGAKCLSSSQISQCRGLVLHDSHAEILALRAFSHWVLEECKSMLSYAQRTQGDRSQEERVSRGHDDSNCPSESPFLRWRTRSAKGGSDVGLDEQKSPELWPPFEFRDDVDIWMYCTCAPCGDASMELCMARQDDPTPWEVPLPNDGNPDTNTDPTQQLLDGRGYFSILGVVRRKPSRADSEQTLSKSCSDKLAVKQVTSLLSFPTSILVAPSQNAYLKNLLLPEDEISRVACDRCFGNGETGRLNPLRDRIWKTTSAPGLEYTFRPFTVLSLSTEIVDRLWEFRKTKDPAKMENYKPGNISAVWTAAPLGASKRSSLSTNLNETLINGVKQGHHLSSPSGRKASALSRARMWDLFREIVRLLPACYWKEVLPVDRVESGQGIDSTVDDSEPVGQRVTAENLLQPTTYASFKYRPAQPSLSQTRNQVLTDVRGVLGNWIRNHGDEGWGLDVLTETETKKGRKAKATPRAEDQIHQDANVDYNH